ncbi:TPA: HNH endonuclease [Klebsiella oxytoca]|nr:HNH endonuclease [Klebsiella oxytoca]
MTDEIWLEIEGFEGRYEISNFGRVRSVGRFVNMMRRNGIIGKKWKKERILKTHTWGAPYPGIVLLSDDMKRHRKAIHQLVAKAFLPNPMGYLIVDHIDSNSHNARVDNLRWCTVGQNIEFAYQSGNRKIGKEHHFAKLPRNESGFCQKE